MVSKVILIRCEDYNEETVNRAILKGFDLVDPERKLFEPDTKIFLKPHLVVRDSCGARLKNRNDFKINRKSS